jgi:rod shape-determining protein MreD
MNKKELKIYGLIWIILLFIQTFMPAFKMNQIIIQPDLLLVLVAFVALRFNGEIAIIFAFINGLIQDFSTQESLLGILALSKTTTAYAFHFVQHYHTIWTRKIKLSSIFLIFVIHNIIYFYFYLSGTFSIFLSGLFVIMIQSIISFLIFIILERILFKSKLI